MKPRGDFHIITQTNWLRDEATQGTTKYDIQHSYGFDVPIIPARTGAYMPQPFAVQLSRTYKEHNLPPLRFIAPPPALISTMPTRYTKRAVRTLTVNEAVSTLFPWDDGLWWKMATAKADFFPAQARTHEELLQQVDEHKLPLDAWLQYSEPILNIKEEYRFFLNRDSITAHSIYLNDGVTSYDGAEPTPLLESKAIELINEMCADYDVVLPPQVVADVAVTANGEAYLLEFNPVWCSAWYECHIDSVLDTITDSFKATKTATKKWGYEPDALLIHRYGEKSLRPVLPLGR